MDDEFSGGWLILALALFLVGIICLATAFYQRDSLPQMTQFVLTIIGVIATMTATLLLVCHFGPRLVDIYRQARYAHAETEPRIMLIKALQGMDKETMRLASHYVGVLTAIGGTTGPVWQWRTGDSSAVPFEFMRSFVLATTQDKGRYWLPPIRTWAEGSLDRGYAEELTAHFIQVGLAKAAVGHYPAEWFDFDTALRWTGLSDDWRE
jgi:hypothetical protein